jgi:NTP pyrophosphatase (non-canonical NTP hydrolase)
LQFNEYQAQALKTASYPNLGHNLVYPALGMAGESGEAADKIKKFWRNFGVTDGAALTSEQKLALLKEVGDVLWYIAAIATELGHPLALVAELNLAKLQDRQERGVIKSEGDNR